MNISALFSEPLPAEAVLPELFTAFSQGNRCILEASPGAGKTTRIPLALLKAPWLSGKNIVMLEPRRMAARNAARYMAKLLGEEVGQTVGYRIRLESRVSPATRITIVTEGILTRMLQDNPELPDIGCLIFDEFHERNLNADLGLALALDVQDGLRDDLRILVMSATLDMEPLRSLLAQDAGNDMPVLRCAGRVWPTETRYLPIPRSDMRLEVWVAEAVRHALRDESGSILVFLPGTAEIRKTEALLEDVKSEQILVCPLYGNLPAADQDAAIAPPPEPVRKVVLATSIAESSLTIEGVRVVIDSGLSRRTHFDAGTGLTRLVTERVSLAGAEQRRGRAGRMGPGICYRLWHQHDETAMSPHIRPEIQDTDMASLCLELAVWGVKDPKSLRWIDAPPEQAVSQALSLLQRLEAVDAAGRVTERGRAMARLPLPPRLAHMVLASRAWGLERQACLLAALAGERDPLRERDVDVRSRLALLEHGRNTPDVSRIRESARQIRHLIARAGAFPERLEQPDEAEEAGLLLALAYPDRIAQRRARGSFRMVNGHGGILDETDSLADTPLLAVGAVNDGSGNARIWQAAPLSPTVVRTVYGNLFHEETPVCWDSREEAVLARKRICFGEVVLEDAPVSSRDAGMCEKITDAVLDGIRMLGLACLPWTDELAQWRLRIKLLSDAGLGEWPDVSDDALLRELPLWLGPFLQGISRRAQFPRIDLAVALRALLPWKKQKQLEMMAPEYIDVPSGSRARLRYESAGGEIVPVLAVKLQEMFGMRTSPVIAEGRVPVLVQLLSPAGRPLQVTKDLEGFWKNGYAAVRAEMRGRYPKHPWPEDPLSALPTRLTNRRLHNS